MNLSVADKIQIAPLLDELGRRLHRGRLARRDPEGHGVLQARGQGAGLPQRRARGVRQHPQGRHACGRRHPGAGPGRLRGAGGHLVAKHDIRHAERALRTTGEENIAMIADTVGFLVREGRRVIVDAEHFFDGYRFDPAYSRAAVLAAFEAGAETVVPVRHQRRDGAGLGGADRARDPRRRRSGRDPRDARPQRLGLRGRQHARRGRGRVHPRAGDGQRIRRAHRQRRPAVRRREPRAQVRAAGCSRRPRATSVACGT